MDMQLDQSSFSSHDLVGSLLEHFPFLDAVETKFNVTGTRRWVSEHFHVFTTIAVLYVVSVFMGTAAMKSRTPYDLRKALFLWNVGLAVFSLYGALSLGPNLIHAMTKNGLNWAVCNTDLGLDPHLGLWEFLFMFSKVIELGDTVFVVLRKSPLMFLHWYHHFSVLLYVTYGYGFPIVSAIEHHFSFNNFVVHTVMYTYYALKAANVRVPSFVALIITFLQILQMFIAICFGIMAYMNYLSGLYCEIELKVFYAGMLLYSTYIVLFVHFFYKRYCTTKK